LRSTDASALRILFNAGRLETADRAVPRRRAGEHEDSARGMPDAQIPNFEVRLIRQEVGTAADVPAPADRGAARNGGVPRELPGLDLTLAEWLSDSFPFCDFDRFAEALAADAPGGAFEIRLSGEARGLAPAALQVVTRCQRLAAHRNAASACELFERVLAGHRRYHDLTRPQAASVYARALDTWQWLLRLDREAGLAPQLAALFRHIARLVTEAGAGADSERRAPGGVGQACVDDRARHGTWITDELLAELDVDLATRVRVHRLLGGRRRPPTAADPLTAEVALLDDADALSFFSIDSAAYLDDFGAERAERKVARTLARLRPASRAWLRGLRLRTTVARLVQQELAHRAAAGPGGGSLAAAPCKSVGAAIVGAGSDAVGPIRGGKPSRATAIARSRLAAGLAGGAGIARTRTGALLARAAALGALAAHPPGPETATAAPRAVAVTCARSAPASDIAAAPRARQRIIATAGANPARTKRPTVAAVNLRER